MASQSNKTSPDGEIASLSTCRHANSHESSVSLTKLSFLSRSHW